jgi:TolB-like protein/Tfp pilus assembly protein PilF/predicted Ser/Thr protein kinase
MPLSVGEKLGPYEILAPIGAGGMGEVYRARDPRLNRDVAIKRLKGSHSARFEQEAHAIAALNHPHICQIYDIGPDYLVMEYVEGQPLRGPMPVDETLRLARQIAAAMEEAHAKGILHRDLKPANILQTRAGVKVLDFGLAKLATSGDSGPTQTMEGTVLGTAAYMSPEQTQGKPLDERSDIFSFGAVLYELLSGHRPFTGGSTVEVLSAVLRDEPAPLKAPAPVLEIVRRCMAKHAADRFASMAELKTALDQIAAKPAVEHQPSIAVLPFANMSGDKEQEYFSDGLAEEIINALAQIPGLKVIARTSAFAFRGKEQDIRKIAEALGVATILEGSVRRAGSRIRITAQLITAADGSHLWSQRYDREMEDVFAVQDELAATIASVLHTKLAQPKPEVQPSTPRHHTPKLPAYEAYLKARHHQWKITPENLARAKEYYEQAIALDPDFALAHVGYADYFLLRAAVGGSGRQFVPLAREAAQKALDLDPSLPEANAMLGIVAAVYAHDWKEAERRFRLALAHDPVPPQVLSWHAFFCVLPAGQLVEAVEEFRRALQQDPLNVQFRYLLGLALLGAGRLAEAETESRQTLEIDPSFFAADLALSISIARQGRFAEALECAERAYSAAPWYAASAGQLAGMLVRTGNAGRAEELLQKLRERRDEDWATPGFFIFHLACGEPDQTADWIEKLIEQRSSAAALYFRIAQAACASPRWPKLAALMNLPTEAS